MFTSRAGEQRRHRVHIGVGMFATDYAIPIDELARETEARGFESLWVPEHTHIPTSRRTPWPGGSELPLEYSHTYDPFVSLMLAAAVTKTPKLGTGICLVIERDTITLAKEVASLDNLSGGRFLFGIGGGWNAEEMADHGTAFATRFKKLREQIEAMKAIWTETKPEYHGEIIDFPPMMTWPKPVQKPHPPVILGGAFPHAARRALRYGDGWIPHSRRPQYQDVTDFLPQFRQMAAEAGRDLASVPVTVWGVPPEYDRLRRYEDQGVARGVVQLAAEKADTILPILDRWAGLIQRIRA